MKLKNLNKDIKLSVQTPHGLTNLLKLVKHYLETRLIVDTDLNPVLHRSTHLLVRAFETTLPR